MPTHVHQLLVKAVLFVICAAGVAGALVLGVIGIRAGAHGELERILAIVCVALAAGSYLGLRADGGPSDAKKSFLSVGDKLMLIVSAPLLLFCAGVFVATLLPAWYVIVPTFAALWNAVFGRPRRRVSAPPAAHRPMRQPAYG